MATYWLGWSLSEIILYNADGQLANYPHTVTPDYRYQTQFTTWQDGCLIKLGDNRRTFLLYWSNASSLQVIPLPNELQSLPCSHVKFLPQSQQIVGFSTQANTVILWNVKTDSLSIISQLPTGFIPHDITQNKQGQIWLCGSVGSTLKTMKERRALIHSGDSGKSWQVIDRSIGGLRTAVASVLDGDSTSYHTINMVGSYLVVSSLVGDIDSESTHLFVRDTRRWHSKVVRDDTFKTIITGENGLAFIFHFGTQLMWNGRWKRSSLIEKLSAVISQKIDLSDDTHLQIYDASGTVDRMSVVVGILKPSLDGILTRVGEAVCYINSGIANVNKIHYINDPEIIAIASPKS